VIPEAAVEAAVAAVQQETYGADWAARIARIAVNAAAPHLIQAAKAEAWDEAYGRGVEDERTSSAWGTDYGPNRDNPYR